MFTSIPNSAMRKQRNREEVIMKPLVFSAAIAAIGSLFLISAASAQQEASREDAVRVCISEAQAGTPNVSDANDPRVAARYNQYSSCMKRLGHNP